jgi:hypothetical protein
VFNLVRCDDFYRKWQKAGNFCEKHPDTAELITVYLEKIIPLLEEVAAKSEILNNGSKTMVPQLSERASRPLISEKDPTICKAVMEQIVKKAEEKILDGQKPQVTNREVAQIVGEIKGSCEPTPLPQMSPGCCCGQTQEEPASLAPVPNQVKAVQQLNEEQEAYANMPAIPLIVTNVLDLKGIRSMLKDKTCPCCGVPAAGNLVWKCCGSTLNNSIDVAEAAAHKFFEEAEAKSRASRLANGWVKGVNL